MVSAALKRLLGPANFAEYQRAKKGLLHSFVLPVPWQRPPIHFWLLPHNHEQWHHDIHMFQFEPCQVFYHTSIRVFVTQYEPDEEEYYPANLEDSLLYLYSFPDRLQRGYEDPGCGYVSFEWVTHASR